MTVNPNWPLNVTQVAFTTDPFNADVTPVWVDLSTRVQALNSSRGRQYELDTITAGEASLVLLDSDEALNPANTSSVYYPNVKVYRRIIDQAMWPPTPQGAATNLLNTNTRPTGIDPTFDSYSVGTTPSFVTAVGGTSPVIGTTTPHSGLNDLSYSVVALSLIQGAAWTVPCIPGQQYTSSAFVRQSSASTQIIRVTDQVALSDGFDRTVAANWGTPDVGTTWTCSTPADCSVSNGIASITPSLTADDRFATTNLGSVEQSVYAQVKALPALPVGGAFKVGATVSFTDLNNHYVAFASIATTGVITVQISKRVGGSITSLASATLTGVNPLRDFSILFSGNGQSPTANQQLNFTVWQTGTTMPTTPSVQAADQSLAPTTTGGVFVRRDGSSPTTGQFAMVQGVAAVNGTTTTTTGSYVRLSVTWTATQPVHTIRVGTLNFPVGGTVLIDDIQHEVGASASAFASTGPVIYSVFGGFIERWPSGWNFHGTYGMAQITAVDAFAPMAGQNLWTEYRNSILAKRPDYYWPLNEPQNATSFADASGNQGPSMTVNATGIFGTAGVTITSGNQSQIAGDPSGTGIQVNTSSPGANLYYEGECLWVPGPSSNTTGHSVPVVGANSGDWAITVAYWFKGVPWTNASTDIAYTHIPTAQYGSYFQGGGYPNFALLGNDGHVTAGQSAGTPPNFSSQYTNFVTSSAIYRDGNWHHLVLVTTTTAATSTTTTALWVDGVQIGTTSTVVYTGAQPQMRITEWSVAGIFSPLINHCTATFGTDYQPPMAHVVVWNRALSTSEVADLWNAGKGYPGDRSDQRIARYLGYRYIAPSSLEVGASTMDVSTLAPGTALLDACQNVALSENGILVTTPGDSGTVTFQARTHRYFETAPRWVFGENAAASEIPYLDDISFDFDPTQIYNDVQVVRSGGITAIGGTSPNIVASQNAYGLRSFSRTINVTSDLETQDAANWIFTGHRDPVQRVSHVSIDPASNPSLWNAALGVEIGDRATLKRRTSNGLTISADYFVERVEHSREPGAWKVSFQMSPAAITRQPGVLDNATYGLLDSTAILGY